MRYKGGRDAAVLEQMVDEISDHALFRYCVEARCETSVPAETWLVSLDDRLIDHESGIDLDRYVWGVKWRCLDPGAKLLPQSEATCRWSKALGSDFHEVRIETNAHNLTSLFSDPFK
ncbi:hypothetical protein [Streptomyces sp. NPDC058084]|uniref:YxiG-like protein n=1 Tax=Streptomyces sp. NPDC058084 TaxID=3346333 RepID=UPI0036EF7C0C